jgi:hypothetical protein
MTRHVTLTSSSRRSPAGGGGEAGCRRGQKKRKTRWAARGGTETEDTRWRTSYDVEKLSSDGDSGGSDDDSEKSSGAAASLRIVK